MNRTRRTTALMAGAALLLSACTGDGGATASATATTSNGGASATATATASNPVAGELRLLTPIFEGADGKAVLEDELLPKFYEKYPDVSVSVDYTSYKKLNEKLTTALASGLVPDVMMMGVGWVEPFAARGALGPLEVDESSLSGYAEEVLKAGRWEGELYALPVMLDTRIGIYRKDMFKEAGIDGPPTSWKEIAEVAVKLTERDGSGKLTRAGIDVLSLDPRQMWEVLLWSNGGDLFNEDGSEVRFNSPEGVEALQFVTDLIRVQQVEDIGFSEQGADPLPIINDRAAMMIGHNNVWTTALKQRPELIEKDLLGAFLIEESEPAMFYGGTLATMSSSSKYPAAAQALVEFLASEDAALAASEQRGNVPALTKLLDTEYVKNNGFVQFAMQNLENGHPEGGNAAWLEIRSGFKAAIEAALLGQKSPQQALDDLAADAKAAMARLN